jgi:hypothetical protein
MMLIMSKSIEDSLEVLCSFLHGEYDVEVHRDSDLDNAYFPSIRILEINSDMPLEEQYHTLLHEASHVVLYPDTREAPAWEFAEKFVESLDLAPLNANFFRLKTECINEYLNLNKGGLA